MDCFGFDGGGGGVSYPGGNGLAIDFYEAIFWKFLLMVVKEVMVIGLI